MSIPPPDEGLLAIDVGGATQDILVYRPDEAMENCPKMVMPSPTRLVAGRIARATSERRPLFLFGEIMGGGICTRAARDHLAAGVPLYATPSAALTFNDDLARVEQMGVIMTESPPQGAVHIRMGDVDAESIASSLRNFGVEPPVRWAVAVQDHGHSPGKSNREARFEWYREFIDSGGQLDRLAFLDAPGFFTRMRAVKKALPDALVMDTGTAAILGALLDDHVHRHKEALMVVNAGNYHVMCAMVRDERMVGLLEHHTGLLDPAGLAGLLARFRAGELTHEEVLRQGGHGCHVHADWLRKAEFGFIAVTGPRRELLLGQEAHMAVPYGDMMLTGCYGLVEAARRKGMLGE